VKAPPRFIQKLKVFSHGDYVPAPMHMAKKKSFLSAPRIVRGRERER
jgi:hypothetical protein